MPFRPTLLLILLFKMSSTFAAENSSLKHYGVAKLTDPAIEASLAARFKAGGSPLFLIHNLRVGVSAGDFMQFKDKAVLIDAKVWQTLSVEGALKNLKQAPIVRIQAKSNSKSWKNRATRIKNQRKKKAYLLGAEILKILEDHFEELPTQNEMTLQFRQNNLVLLAPDAFLDRLKFRRVQKIPELMPAGAPVFVSRPPETSTKVGAPFNWQAWAVDPQEPSQNLKYDILDTLPEGLAWEPEDHSLSGVGIRSDSVPVSITVTNNKMLSDTLRFHVVFKANHPPVIINAPAGYVKEGEDWFFTPLISDPDDDPAQTTISLDAAPAGMVLDSNTLRWTIPFDYIRDRFEIKLTVSDTAGGSTQANYEVMIHGANRPPVFVSTLNSWVLEQGQTPTYRPIAIDPDGDSVEVRAILPESDELSWDGEQLNIKTEVPGYFSVEFQASDSAGNIAKQRIAYRIKPKVRTWRGVTVKTDFFSDQKSFEILGTKRNVRLGLRIPAIDGTLKRFFGWDRRDFPYFIVGTNFFTARGLQQGRYMWVDGGLIFNRTASRLTSGGLLVRLDSRFASRGSFPGFVEVGFIAAARQAILLVETPSESILDFEQKHLETAKRLFSEYNEKYNVLLELRVEGWYPLGLNVWSGPIFWRLDLPLAERFEQRLGWGIRYHWRSQRFNISSGFRSAWGGSTVGHAMYWDLRFSFGHWN